MFGFWFSITGLFFGFICSMQAKKKNRMRGDWFILGFLFTFLALVIINSLHSLKNNDDSYSHNSNVSPGSIYNLNTKLTAS